MGSNNAITSEINKSKTTFSSTKTGWQLVPIILNKIVPPKFPNRDFNIIKYGAIPDGKTLSTEAFKKAIDACSKTGGGEVVVPKGLFLTGAIHLKSSVKG